MVTCLALLPDGLRFVSGSSDGTARIAEHGFAFEPDPAWVEAEAKREAERRAYAYLARLTGQQYGNKPPPAAPAAAAPRRRQPRAALSMPPSTRTPVADLSEDDAAGR